MGALFAICLCIGYVGARNIQQWALYEDAGVRGIDWADHIDARITASDTVPHTDDEYVNGKLPDPAAFQTLLADIISAGHIYQIDFINLYCFCEVSLGSFQSKTTGPHASDHGNHKHHDGHIERLPDRRFSHVLNAESSHTLQPG